MVVDRYSEDMLATAFGHLCEKEKAAKGFLAKNAKLEVLDGWLFVHSIMACLFGVDYDGSFRDCHLL